MEMKGDETKMDVFEAIQRDILAEVI